jgi:probable phosphoglycerate mutase
VARLLLVRHAQSAWNVDGRWQGHADPPLSELGERQALIAARAVAGVARVVSSDLARARRTAEVIAEALGLSAVEVRPALRERDVGAWSGLTADEVDRQFPGYRAGGRTPPGWEHDAVLLERVLPALVEIGESSPKDAVVVSHGGVLRLVESHLGAPKREHGAMNLDGRWLVAEDGGFTLGPAVQLLDS